MQNDATDAGIVHHKDTLTMTDTTTKKKKKTKKTANKQKQVVSKSTSILLIQLKLNAIIQRKKTKTPLLGSTSLLFDGRPWAEAS